MPHTLGMTVFHSDIYHGQESMKIVGIRENEIELEGDYSGGTSELNCQKDWQSRSGILLEKPIYNWFSQKPLAV